MGGCHSILIKAIYKAVQVPERAALFLISEELDCEGVSMLLAADY